MTERREPNERVRPDLTPEDWEVAVQWRPFAYQEVKAFASKTMGRPVSYKGRIGESNFEWIIPGGLWFGVDPVGLAQDLEHRALEAVAVAAKDFNAQDEDSKGHYARKYMHRVIWRDLTDEYERWKRSSTNVNTTQYGLTGHPVLPEGVDEPGYNDPHDADDIPGLNAEDQRRLQIALGALTSKEAWALRMQADGTPVDIIAENLGYKSAEAVYKLLRRAREKGQKAYEAQS